MNSREIKREIDRSAITAATLLVDRFRNELTIEAAAMVKAGKLHADVLSAVRCRMIVRVHRAILSEKERQ